MNGTHKKSVIYMDEMTGKVVNRQERRWQAAIARRGVRPNHVGFGKHAMNGNKFRFTMQNWKKRIVKEMRDNLEVIDLVLSGKLDYYL